MSGHDYAGLLISKSAIILLTDSPRAALNFLWNKTDERPTAQDFQVAMMGALLTIRRDLLKEDPPYWGRVITTAQSLGIMDRDPSE